MPPSAPTARLTSDSFSTTCHPSFRPLLSPKWGSVQQVCKIGQAPSTKKRGRLKEFNSEEFQMDVEGHSCGVTVLELDLLRYEILRATLFFFLAFPHSIPAVDDYLLPRFLQCGLTYERPRCLGGVLTSVHHPLVQNPNHQPLFPHLVFPLYPSYIIHQITYSTSKAK